MGCHIWQKEKGEKEEVNKFYDVDLPYGEAGEKVVLEIIQKKYPKAYKMQGNFKEYDIKIPETEETVEVKRDKQTDISGNAFIETYYNHNKSGINATTADYWIYVTKGYLYVLKASDIKLCIEHNSFFITERGHIIDGIEVDAYLVPMSYLHPYCISIKKLTEEQLCQLN